MKFLLDTVVLSEFRKHEPNPHVVRWLQEAKTPDLFPGVVTIGEVERGIGRIFLLGERCIVPTDGSVITTKGISAAWPQTKN
uniref:PIN domain-containing protein n=1 Tax=Candidatus Kentrum sp. FM TaxID=2126340 RepID=A0A450TN07_9GAMM|nr:MAG: hypothetical protein BECKFM1743A_GA0114220_104992 [Candidatus Kentron sp. FM]VFJ69942.1 MAG: hypothetical protein BECKFM1743C_GA0114222_105382 [Candidatus Kentron sp. FM]VFK18187.1 MAG: hypothetical protein BECKFM1743B_GA0114221_105302 [Candidatus Kentron sp. FM]